MTLITEATFSVIDTETTGLDHAKDQFVEIASAATTYDRTVGMFATMVNPGIPIPPEVSAVHYLLDRDVADAPAIEDSLLRLFEFERTMDCTISVAHNAAFDEPFIARFTEPFHTPSHALSFACTKRLAMHVWPDAPNYKNQTLRFWRKLNVDTFGILPHRALADALVTAAILRDILTCDEFGEKDVTTVEELLALSRAPIRMHKWDFGKFIGQPIEAADPGWVDWCLRTLKEAEKPDLFYTLRLGRREGWLV